MPRTLKHGNQLYPWERWEDGKIHRVKQGKNFECEVEVFRALLHSRAKRRGMRVETTRDGDVLRFVFSKAS